jgi:uncharacterized protein
MLRTALMLSAVLCGGAAQAQQVRQTLPGIPGDIYVPMKTMLDRKFASVVRQRYDFSCGSAALASLLRYHYGLAVDEAAVFQGMWKAGDRAQIKKLGFSLLDMKRYLGTHGLEANGYNVSLDDIAGKQVPGIALINIKGYKHFVVVKGMRDGLVLVGDPARGLLAEPRAQFEKSWNHVYFVINPDARSGRFNAARQWASAPQTPFWSRYTEPLSLQALSMTAPYLGEF